MLRVLVLALCSALAAGFTATPAGPGSVAAARSSTLVMKAPLIPKGPSGNYAEPGGSAEEGWIGDQSRGTQIGKFEAGEDYLFFQGPAPKTAIQPDLPSFFSADNFAEMEVTTPQIVITGVGLATAAVVAVPLFS